jgi:glycine reductase
MDLENQKRIKELAEIYSAEKLAVILGTAEAEVAGLTAETVALGDPTFAGPLAGVSLKLPVYHILEDEVKETIDDTLYDEEVGMMEMVLDKESIVEEVSAIRAEI